MAHHITEPTELFPHLEHRDLQVVHEVKALIQDHLYSGARDYSFQNGLVDFYIRTNSQHAMDILCKVREPWDKPLLDKLNDTMKAGAKLQSLTLLLHIVTRQPSWLYKIVQTNLYASLIQCLKTSCDCSVIMCGLLTITTLLPMIPSLIGPSLHDIFEIFSRFVDWNIQRPGNVPEVYHLHIQTAVYTLFHRLYGMFPWNFLQFLRDNYAKRQQDVNETIMPMLVRVRLHPQLILGSGKIETEAARWRKMEVHDILTECSRISLDSAESARDEWSLYNVSAAGSESGRASSSLSSVVNQARRTSSPLDSSRTNSTDQRQKQVSQQRLHPRGAAPPAGAASENLVGLVDSTAMIWSPSVFCGLSTPASSRPGSPGSILDSSFNSSLQLMSATTTPTPLNTPRDSPRLANLTDDVKAAGYGGTDGASLVPVGKSSSAVRLKGKVPSNLRNLPLAHRTVSAPSTPGYAEKRSVPSSPTRKHSVAGVAKCFNFEDETSRGVRSPAGSAQRSREPSGDSSEGQRSAGRENREGSMVSVKDLLHVINGLPGNILTTNREDDMEVSNELSAITDTSTKLRDLERQEKGQLSCHRRTPEEDPPPSPPLPFDVDFMLSDIPCETLKAKLQRRKDQLLSETVSSECLEDDITVKLRSYCRQLLRDTQTADSECTDKSTPIPVPQSQTKTHCEVCSSSGKSIEVTQVTGGNTPLSNTLEGGFTPIRDQPMDHFKPTHESTHDPGHAACGSHVVADEAPAVNLFPFAPTQSWPLLKDGAGLEGSLDLSLSFMNTQSTSRGSSVMGGQSSLMATFSPHELLDRHIQLGDSVHTKELSMLPLTSQTSINWTHFGGAAPADEVNILKNQVIFLHNQVLYERHKRDVHTERNRRLLGKTHKAKACQELNSAMKDQVKLQEHKIQEIQSRFELAAVERGRLQEELGKKDRHYNDTVKKWKYEKTQLQESNQELQKLLVEHKREVDLVRQKLQTTSSELFSVQNELENAQAELGTTKRLKDEITWLNKELLLLGEVNQKLREKTSEHQLGVQSSKEHLLAELTLKKELVAMKETLSEKMVQLNAAKTRITELEASLTNKDVAITEQKRFLETVKSLSNGKIEAIESKYNVQKKINQKQESTILKLTKELMELRAKDSVKHRPYSRTNSEQIAESLKGNEARHSDHTHDRRASWHCQDWQPRESTPVKGRMPSPSSISPVEDKKECQSRSPEPHQKTSSAKSPVERLRATSLPGDGRGQSASGSHDHSDGFQSDIPPPVGKINFSQSSPFQRVRSSYSESSRNQITNSEVGRSKSWPHSIEPTHLQQKQNCDGSTPVVIDISEGKRALVEDETSHVGDESLASILEMDASFEVRHEKES